MPKAPATPREVENIRQNIIREAVSLINDAGFAGFSMRKLGARLGIAAKTIYNYFADKDELYLKVVTRGFEDLFDAMRTARETEKDPHRQLRAMAHTYVRFGIESPHYYNILFSLDVPKYSDYLGSRHEKLADFQNQTALQIARLTGEVIERCFQKKKRLRGRDPAYAMMQVWSTLHGIVSLYNSRVTLEVGEFEPIIERLVDDAVSIFKG